MCVWEEGCGLQSQLLPCFTKWRGEEVPSLLRSRLFLPCWYLEGVGSMGAAILLRLVLLIAS